MARSENILFCYEGNVGVEKARKALVVFSVEYALLTAGDGIYKKVANLLDCNYGRDLAECLNYPEYLWAVLMKIPSEEADRILGSIRKQLEKYSNIKSASTFLSQLESQVNRSRNNSKMNNHLVH